MQLSGSSLKLGLASLVLSAGLPFSAHAQTGQENAPPPSFQQCVDNPPEGDLSACIGLKVQECDTSQGTTAQIVGCVQEETRYWSDRMDQSFAELQSALATQDNGSPYKLATYLGQSQDAWTAWKDSNCSFYSYSLRGGSMGRILQADCELSTVADRFFEIESMFAIALEPQE